MTLVLQDFSFAWLLFCLTLAFLYSFILYKNEHYINTQKRWILGIVRGIVVFTLSIFLFSPLFNRLGTRTEKPILFVVQDNSSSILQNKKAAFYKSSFLDERTKTLNALSEKFDVKDIQLDDRLRYNEKVDYSGNKSKLDLAFEEVLQTYKNRNVAGLVLASDGIYNAGTEPEQYITKLNIPIYTILMGDSTKKTDLAIANVNHNEVVFKENKFVVELYLRTYDLKNQNARIQILYKGQSVWTKSQVISSNDEFIKVEAVLSAPKEAGLAKYTIQIQRTGKEQNLVNNETSFYVDVLDSKQKIALIAACPHPDLSAIKQSIESNQNYEVDIYFADDLEINKLSTYQLIILHQIPSRLGNTDALIKAIETMNLPTWMILGNQSYIDLYNRLNYGLKITGSRSTANDALARFNTSFSGFNLSSSTSSVLSELPPLQSPFGNYSSSNSIQSLLFQNIGSAQTNMPLLCFDDAQGKKIGILAGEGLWKWRMQNFRLKNNYDAINELHSKIIQYLSSKDDKRKFKVSMANAKMELNEDAVFYAELYNDSYELINSPDVWLNIRNAKNKNYQFAFNKNDVRYTLNAGKFPEGEYEYEAKTSLGNKKYSVKGRFNFIRKNIENLNTVANFQLLRNLSKRSNGKAFGDTQWNELSDELLSNTNFKSIQYDEIKTEEWIQLSWIFWLIIILISIEWFARKYLGMY